MAGVTMVPLALPPEYVLTISKAVDWFGGYSAKTVQRACTSSGGPDEIPPLAAVNHGPGMGWRFKLQDYLEWREATAAYFEAKALNRKAAA